MSRITVDIDLNRVEGDLEFQLDVEEGVVVDARCIGTLYRGFEQILIGRAPRDALVITPRVCGICGTAHLYAAALALEQVAGITPSAHATAVRNLCLMTETLQSDLRQTFLFFTPDFCDPVYSAHPLAGELMEMFAPLNGRIARGCLKETRRLLGIVALFGGQWPHSTYMLPGGVTLPASRRRLIDCRDMLDGVREWFEGAVIGGSLDAWMSVGDADEHRCWIEGKQGSALSLFSRFSADIGLDRIGQGTGHLLSYGVNRNPEGNAFDLPAGFFDGERRQVEPLDHLQINEHVRHSWFLHYPGGRHPWQGETIPDHQPGGDRYTWAKAPRYGSRVVQTGPLAELRIAAEPLITDLLERQGDNAWLRQFARLRRAGWLLQSARQTLERLESLLDQPHFVDPGIVTWPDGEGVGMVEAARGALGHWVRIRNGVIEKYQIVTPTAWNASPRDSDGQPGHWERSIIGMPLPDPERPVTVGHVVRSHDPCLVCTVHCIGNSHKLRIDV